ncbi:hypothetical protein O181_122251 [Austropuccinia psidii MF-1]|uniref:Uncharacterized protein n=1 Tax=Austropuccinia psidii MF-1 TaxID=1389203 RepID=A0A9Q3KLX4_9BASI|nr:hypothetical protein [Austropuccinia psidii MF-1]
MSSSYPCKLRSGSVHDSDIESSIECVQTQSPFSPNIPLTTPIASSMNVSSLNIDVGNVMAQNSSTWSMQNISVTPIPPNPTKHKCMCMRGQEAHLKSHQRLIPNQNFHMTSSLILVGIQSHPRIPLDERVDGRQRKRSLKNATQSGLSEGNPGLTLHQHMAPEGKSVQSHETIKDRDELYASSPLVNKEKFTGLHHPYASKPRTG